MEEMIELTADFPSNYERGRVPILDMEVWMERDSRGVSKIRWAFYEKKMKNKFVMMKTSAVGMKAKRRTLVQEVVRRMRNCDRGTELEEIGEVLSKFSQKMRDSGYEEKMRREVIDAGVKVYREQLRKDESGERLLYRRRNGDKEQREQAKKEKRNFWRRQKDKNGGAQGEVEKGGIKMPIMVPYTVNGGLVKKFKKRAKECGVEAVFIERTGYSVQNQLEKAKKGVIGRTVFRMRKGEEVGTVKREEEGMSWYARVVQRQLLGMMVKVGGIAT